MNMNMTAKLSSGPVAILIFVFWYVMYGCTWRDDDDDDDDDDHHHHHHLFTFHRSLFGNNMRLDVETVIHIIKKNCETAIIVSKHYVTYIIID
jgi:hypothetical protein